jgi:hypothetical protein
MDAGVKRLPIAAVGEKMTNVLLVGMIIAKQSPRKVTCKSGMHIMTLFLLNLCFLRDKYGFLLKINHCLDSE